MSKTPPKSKNATGEPTKPRAKGGVGPGKSYLGVILPTEVYDEVKARATQESRSMSGQAAHYITQGLAIPRPKIPGT
jgi:hypothetical protein